MEHDLEMTNVNDEAGNAPVSEPTTQAVGEETTTTAAVDVAALLQVISEKVDAGILPDKAEMDRLTAMIYKRPQQATAVPSADGEEDEEQDLEDAGAEATDADEIVVRFINLQTRYKELRNKHNEEVKRRHEENLVHKKALLDRMTDLLTSTEDFGRIKGEFRKIREEWGAIGEVPQNDKSEILRRYQELNEQFYEINAITNEFREYDFAKNKEEKTRLIELAKALDAEGDVIKAFNELQLLHDRWKETGPVSYDDREVMWKEFKQASTVINKKHQDYFTALREKENDNLQAKTLLCERIEKHAETLPESREGWRKFMDEVKEMTKN